MLKAKEVDDQGKLNDLAQQTIHQLEKQQELEEANAKAKLFRDRLTGKFNPSDPTGLFGDINKVLDDPDAAAARIRKQQADAERAQAAIEDLRERANAGQLLEPQQQDILDAALAQEEAAQLGQAALAETQGFGPDALAGKDFAGLLSLAAQDFTSLTSLADMDFSGLQPLSGLTITIQ
jgi:hypothetical protein